MNRRFNKVDVVILCGGLGKRLRPVIKDRPKVMAKVNGRPFLDILIEYLSGQGFKRLILCIGYMGKAIKYYYRAKSVPLEIVYSEEKKPLGTGGALRAAKSLIGSKTFLVLNGDSFCPVNFSKFFDFHLAKKALFSIALTRLKHGQNCGKVKLDNNQRIVNFKEKAAIKNKEYSSVGIYLLEKRIFTLMGNKRKFSLEYDFFPTLIISKKCFGYTTRKSLIDIGTPATYRKAQNYFQRN